MSVRIYLITLCHIPKNQYHLDEEHLLFCPKLNANQQVFKNTIKLYFDARAMIR